jgi:magnesium chelatase subunit I
MVYEGEQRGVEVVARQIIGEAVKKVFDETFPEVDRALGSGGEDDTGPYAPVVAWFAAGHELLLSDDLPFTEYKAALDSVPGLAELAKDRGTTDLERALAAEMILEGLYLHLKLSRDDLDSQVTYKELVKFQLLRRQRATTPRGDIN